MSNNPEVISISREKPIEQDSAPLNEGIQEVRNKISQSGYDQAIDDGVIAESITAD